MRKIIIPAVFLLCVLAIPSANALVGAENMNFSCDGYETTIAIEYDGSRTFGLVEGGGGGPHAINSLLTIKIYDDTDNYPYVEVYDDAEQIANFTMYEKEVAKLWVENNGVNETILYITDMLGDKSAWINLVDYTCTSEEDIRRFWVYKEGAGFPDAIIRTWLNDCEQLIVPLYIPEFVI